MAGDARPRLRDAGWHDYSLFLRADGLLVGYFLTDDLAASRAAMEATDVNARWQAEMAPFFLGLDGARPDDGFVVLDEIFNLDAQLAGCTGVRRPDMTDLSPSTKERVLSTLRSQRIETPSWAYGNSGTRFKVFAQRASPRTPHEKLDDAAQVHRFTGVAPSVALHIPWDAVDDYAALRAHAADAGVALGHGQRERLPGRRLHARQRHPPATRACGARRPTTCSRASTSWTQTGSRDLKLWFSDGTNYPGQDDIRARQDRLAESLAEVYARIDRRSADPAGVQALRAGLLHDGRAGLGHRRTRTVSSSGRGRRSASTPGHHAPGTNIEFIVAILMRAGRLGAFDFNSRFYADDDLMVGSADPFQLFRILHEVVRGGGLDAGHRDRVHARPVPQHRAEDPRPDPLGHERPGGDRQGAARRLATRWPSRRRRATSWAPTRS